MMNSRRILSTSALMIGAVLLSVGIQTLAYTAPSVAPTGGDADAPLNVGSTNQTKAGGLAISGGLISTQLTTTGTILSQGTVQANTQFCISTSCITAWPDISTFLNTSATAQTKAGALTVNGTLTASGNLSVTGNVTTTGTTRLTGNVGIGQAPTADATGTNSDIKLTIAGRVRIEGGIPGVGKVLTAGGNGGDATWQMPTRIKGGSRTGLGTVSGLGFSDTTYAVALDADGGSTDCRAAYVTSKATTGFTITAGDACTGVIYTWIAIDY